MRARVRAQGKSYVAAVSIAFATNLSLEEAWVLVWEAHRLRRPIYVTNGEAHIAPDPPEQLGSHIWRLKGEG